MNQLSGASSIEAKPNVILATRLHLGNQSHPPTQDKVRSMIGSFLQNSKLLKVDKSVIAVDAECKIEGYDYPSVIEETLKCRAVEYDDVDCVVLPVSPWGSFVPALNALIAWSCKHRGKDGEYVIAFISAEMSLEGLSCDDLLKHMTMEDTLVVGAALPGHDFYRDKDEVELDLNGLNCPWNTFAIWNLQKLALTGFPLICDGLHQFNDGTNAPGGIEEFSTILLHQRLDTTQSSSKAKLVRVSGIEWNQNFDDDQQRKQWHEEKMRSKYTRAEIHRNLLGGIHGKVIHYPK